MTRRTLLTANKRPDYIQMNGLAPSYIKDLYVSVTTVSTDAALSSTAPVEISSLLVPDDISATGYSTSPLLLCPAPNRRGIKRCFCLTSGVCLTSVAYIGPKSRTDRPRNTKICTEAARHVTPDSETTFRVKRSKVKVITPFWLAVQVTT